MSGSPPVAAVQVATALAQLRVPLLRSDSQIESHAEFIRTLADRLFPDYAADIRMDVGDESAVTLIVARYRDKLRRVGGTWKITEKIMEPGWMEQRRLPQPDAS